MLMSQADQSRLESQVGSRHQGGRPYHFATVNQEDRIRRIFGLAEESPLPQVSHETLAAYYEHLAANLLLPFEALFCPVGGDMRQLIHYVRVVELTDPRLLHTHNPHGLFCKAQNAKQLLDVSLADLGVRDENPNCQLVDDYAYWFVNWR
jgi:hypothetical protein